MVDKPKRERSKPVKRDPVVAALIARLPAAGATLPRAQRVNWLRMMAMALDGGHGIEAPIAIDISGGAVGKQDVEQMLTPASKPFAPVVASEDDEQRFFVDKHGFARQSPGKKPIDPTDIPPGSEVEDERERDDGFDTIKWKGGAWPLAAYADRNLVFVKA